MFAAARGLPGLIALGRGDPDYPTPPHIVQAAAEALAGGYTHYTPWNGLPELRDAIAQKLALENGLRMDPEREIAVTTGGQHAIFNAFQALLDPGDEVLIADPHYASYDASVGLAGGVLVPVPTYQRDNFEVQADALEHYVTPRSKVLVLVSPNNPSGNVLPVAALQRLADVARRRGLIVVSDEIYEKFIYDGSLHVSPATLPGMRERTITINSFSKSYAMTGWRLGYLAGPAAFIEAVSEISYTITICPPAATQIAGIAALQGPQDQLTMMVSDYAERRAYMKSALSELGLEYGNPQGGFTVFVNVQASGMNSVDFCLRLLQEQRVQIFPGDMYGPAGAGYVRISFLAKRPELEEGIHRLGLFLRRRG